MVLFGLRMGTVVRNDIAYGAQWNHSMGFDDYVLWPSQSVELNVQNSVYVWKQLRGDFDITEPPHDGLTQIAHLSDSFLGAAHSEDPHSLQTCERGEQQNTPSLTAAIVATDGR